MSMALMQKSNGPWPLLRPWPGSNLNDDQLLFPVLGATYSPSRLRSNNRFHMKILDLKIICFVQSLIMAHFYNIKSFAVKWKIQPASQVPYRVK